jgi:hypothetical protein
MNAYGNNVIPQNFSDQGISSLIYTDYAESSASIFIQNWLDIGFSSEIQAELSDEDMLHAVETTPGTLGFVPFRLANSSTDVSILGVVDDQYIRK